VVRPPLRAAPYGPDPYVAATDLPDLGPDVPIPSVSGSFRAPGRRDFTNARSRFPCTSRCSPAWSQLLLIPTTVLRQRPRTRSTRRLTRTPTRTSGPASRLVASRLASTRRPRRRLPGSICTRPWARRATAGPHPPPRPRLFPPLPRASLRQLPARTLSWVGLRWLRRPLRLALLLALRLRLGLALPQPARRPFRRSRPLQALLVHRRTRYQRPPVLTYGPLLRPPRARPLLRLCAPILSPALPRLRRLSPPLPLPLHTRRASRTGSIRLRPWR
jgi:hypothetical protein